MSLRAQGPPSLTMGTRGHSEPLKSQDSFPNVPSFRNRKLQLRQMFTYQSDQISQGFREPVPPLVPGVLPLSPLLGDTFLRGEGSCT